MDVQEQSALKWSGLAGILGSILLLGVFGFLAAFVGFETVEGEAAVARFPDIRWARVIENTAYLLSIALWALHSVGLFIAMRRTAMALSLAAVVMSLLGLGVLAAGAIPHTATTAISELYRAPGATAELQAALVVAWQTSQAWVDTFVVTGAALTPIGLLLYGFAMLATPSFGKILGWITIVFGAVGIYAAISTLIEESDIIALGIFALIFFHVIVGWKTSRL